MKRQIKPGFILGVMIAILFVLVLLLTMQNFQLKKQSKGEIHPVQTNGPDDLLIHLEEQFLFKKIPVSLDINEFYFSKDIDVSFANGYLVILFDMTVCGHCLSEELELLKQFEDGLKSKGIQLFGIVGIVSKKEESNIIDLRRTNQIFFPIKTIEVKTLYRIFKLPKDRFLDTPFFIYTSHQLQIISIFKPKYQETKGLYRWLNILSNQEMP